MAARVAIVAGDGAGEGAGRDRGRAVPGDEISAATPAAGETLGGNGEREGDEISAADSGRISASGGAVARERAGVVTVNMFSFEASTEVALGDEISAAGGCAGCEGCMEDAGENAGALGDEISAEAVEAAEAGTMGCARHRRISAATRAASRASTFFSKKERERKIPCYEYKLRQTFSIYLSNCLI